MVIVELGKGGLRLVSAALEGVATPMDAEPQHGQLDAKQQLPWSSDLPWTLHSRSCIITSKNRAGNPKRDRTVEPVCTYFCAVERD
jgi:hypothetical protein